ncbi:hypothetical protein SK128_003232, partial [Halocaridina rubra]
MAQPLRSPSQRGHGLPSHPHKQRKLSVPHQLQQHVQGSFSASKHNTSHAGLTRGSMDYSTGHASGSSSLCNTPSTSRHVHFFRQGSDNVFESPVTEESQSERQLPSRSSDGGIDNQSFVSDENTSSAVDMDNQSGGGSSRASGDSNSTMPDPSLLRYSDVTRPPTTTDNDPGSPRFYSTGKNIKENRVRSSEIRKDMDPENDMKEVSQVHSPPPTEAKTRKEWLISSLSTNMSIVYILLLIVAGLVSYLKDMFSGSYSAVSESFNLYLISAELFWLMYIHLDVRRYIGRLSRLLNKTLDSESDTEKNQPAPTYDDIQDQYKKISLDYGFTFSSHGGSLYLKIGAT